MSLEIVPKDVLKKMIQDEVSNSDELDGDCKEVVINSIDWHEPDESGSNWDISSLRNSTGCVSLVNAITLKYKKKYNIEDE